MAIKQPQRGFTLLIAVIFMTVMLSFGLALGSLGYKQLVLSSVATESQYAFYAADSATECALYADQQDNIFAYPASDPVSLPPPKITCDGSTATLPTQTWLTLPTSYWIVTNRLSLDSGKRCADVTIYKYASPLLLTGETTKIYSQGYNVPCDGLTVGARVVSRAIWTKY